MWEQPLQTCRFCKESDWAGSNTMVKYGVRHYAHYRCYLNAGKLLSDLHGWQVGQFPYRVIDEFGLAEQAEDLVKEQHRP